VTDESGLDVVMLLCDSAQVAGGKLYVLGGGWSQYVLPHQPLTMALAVKMSIPWDRANHRFNMAARLVTDDGEAVLGKESGEQIRAEGQVEVGRPVGLKPGEYLDAPFVLNFNGVTLDVGGYVWELWVDDAVEAKSRFRVRQPPSVG
jgi:hypothetical protein